MLKKVIIGFGILIMLILAAGLYLNHRNRSLSPSGSTRAEVDGFEVKVDYARPSVRGRVLFGTKAEGALQPYGKYWRLGANEPTKLIVNRYFLFEGEKMDPGTYDMYAIPAAGEMEIRLNSADRFWGATEPDYALDVLSVRVPLRKVSSETEQFTIKAVKEKPNVRLDMKWGNYIWSVTVAPL